MIKLRINLIRHGEKRLFLANPGLTELGKNQAETLAKHLAANQPSIKIQRLILTSPQRRTQETAAILAKKLKLTVQVDDFLDIDHKLPNNPANKQKILAHFANYAKKVTDQVGVLEIFAVTHSQEVRNFWQILGGPAQAIKDVYECGMWTILVDEDEVKFEWTEGDLNP